MLVRREVTGDENDVRDQHWTARSTEDMRFSVGADVILQIEEAMHQRGLTQKQIADSMGVTESRVSQLLKEVRNNNFTLDTILRLGEAVGMKVAVVLYDDVRESGAPVNAQVFTRCWQDMGKPEDFWKWHREVEDEGGDHRNA